MSAARLVVAGAVAAAVAAAVVVALRRDGRTPAADPAPPSRPSASAPRTPEPPPASPDEEEGSLYDLDLEHLVDASGRAVELDVHEGHPVVVSMFYATCPAACPALMLEMKDMDRQLDARARERVRYLLVSFDPDRDDVAALAKVREDHGLDERWTLARTDEREVRVLATALGLRYRFRADGEIDHSTNLALVRPDGGLDVRVDGLAQPKDEMVRRIGELAAAADP